MGLELVSFAICPYVQRAVIALKEKSVEFDVTYIELDNPPSWFKEISPLGKVPLLKVDDEVLFESAIITEYLDEVYPPALHPRDPLLRARHRSWIEFGSNLLVEQTRAMLAQDEDGFLQQTEALGGGFARLLGAIGDGPYFMGEHFSMVDAAYAPFFMRYEILKEYRDDLEDLLPTRLASWSGQLLARPSVRDSVVDDFRQRLVSFGRSKGSYILSEG